MRSNRCFIPRARRACPSLALATALLTVAAVAQPSRAALIASYQFNSPTPLVNSAGASTYEPNAADPGGAATPTFLSNGGVNGSGAYQFDGTANYLAFAANADMYIGLNLAQQFVPDWTASFWVKTTDAATFGGSPFSMEVPVFGDPTTNVRFGLGVNGGKATLKQYNGVGMTTAQGTTNIADGIGHYVTLVGSDDGTASFVDIYIDGALDAAHLAKPRYNLNGMYSHDIGSSYNGGSPNFGAFTLDDVRVYDEGLSAETISELFSTPEPTGAALVALSFGGATLGCRRRHSQRPPCREN